MLSQYVSVNWCYRSCLCRSLSWVVQLSLSGQNCSILSGQFCYWASSETKAQLEAYEINHSQIPDEYQKAEEFYKNTLTIMRKQAGNNATTPRFVSFLPPPAKLQEEEWRSRSDGGDEFLKKLEQWIKGTKLTMAILSRSDFLPKPWRAVNLA